MIGIYLDILQSLGRLDINQGVVEGEKRTWKWNNPLEVDSIEKNRSVYSLYYRL